MKVGIMGGTLDPVHIGHLQIAQMVREVCGLDSVTLLPAGDPPHKRRITDQQDRMAMARLAAEGRPGMTASDAEVSREGVTYTVDTLRILRKAHPENQWTYIIGADTVNVLETWRSFEKVAGLCDFAAVGRPGCDTAQARAHAEMLEARYSAKIRFLEANGPDISSTQIRERVARGESIAHLVPEAVEEYIRRNGLYLCGLSWAELEETLKARLKPGRFIHTLGVAETAQNLAERYGVDPQRARLAGLLHDCAKWMEYSEMVKLVRENVPDADEDELAAEPVLHAPAGRVLAEREYGVQDPDILAAIRTHTLGGKDMTPLQKLIYVADFVEPNRKPFDGLERARALAETDLDAAVRVCAELTARHIVQCGGQPHPLTLSLIQS